MSNFLRGGQVTAHKFRMTLQVIRIIMKVAFCVILLTVFLTFKNNISGFEWKMVPVLCKNIYQDLDPEKIITYSNKRGIEVSAKVKYLGWNGDLVYVERKFYYVMMLTLKRLIWVIASSLICSILFFWLRGRYLHSNTQIRGSCLIKDSELKKQVRKHNEVFSNLQTYCLADIPYPATGKKDSYTPGEQAHTLVLGATGSGKTKVIQDIVKQIRKQSAKAIIVDVKGDYIQHFYDSEKRDIILNPLDKRGANWSFFNETDPLRGFDTIAKTLIPDAGSDAFWVNAARLIFSEFVSICVNLNLSLAEFADKLLSTDLASLEKALSQTKAKHLVNQKADKTVQCIMMIIAIHLAPFKLYYKKEECFSISKWINDKSQSNFLFIASSPDTKASLNNLVQMQVDIAINALCSSKDSSNNQVWFILDELAYFDQGITNLKDGLTMSRSFGGAFVVGAQDMASLSKIYGHELSRVIANNCRNKLIMNVDDSYTARWCSELFGDGEVEEWNEGLSYGSHEMRDGVNSNKSNRIKRTILPSEFAQLKTGSGYIRLPGFNPALLSFKNVQIAHISESYEEDTVLRQVLQQEMRRVQITKEELEEELKTTARDAIEKEPTRSGLRGEQSKDADKGAMEPGF